MEKVYELLLLFSSYLILGLINVFMPYFTRRTESFGVSIPEEVFEEEILKDLRKRYVIYPVFCFTHHCNFFLFIFLRSS